MGIFDDLTNALTKPPEDPMLKEIEEQRRVMASLERGDHVAKVAPEDTPIGKQLAELQKLREDFDKYRADYVADKASDEERRKRERLGDRVFAIFAGAVSGIIGSAIGGLVVYYWPSIFAFLEGLFQKISPP